LFYFAQVYKSTAISFSNKIKNRAIWRDLLALPPRVFAKRVAKRVLNKKGSSIDVSVEKDPQFNPQDFSKLKAKRTDAADFVVQKYLNAEADFLGTGWRTFKGYWQKDFRFGFEWDDSKPSGEQLGLGLHAKGADIKVPWEFGRMHQLLRVSFYSKDRSTDYIKAVLKDFRENNKVGFGSQWMNAMEVAIRAINMSVAFDKTGYDENEDLVFLQEHFSFILKNLEHKEGLGNNHYLANLTGLLFGLIYFPSWKGLLKERPWIINEFCSEIDKQFYSDGGNFEGSTYYHCLSTEIALLGLACLINLGENDAVQKVQSRISLAYEFLKSMVKPNGELPQFGDNDSGSILPLSLAGEWLTPQEREVKYSNLEKYSKGKPHEEEFVESLLNVSGVIEMGNALFEKTGQGLEYDFIKALTHDKALNYISKIEDPELDEDLGLVLPEHKTWVLEFSKIDVDEIQSFYSKDFGVVVLKSDKFFLALSLLQRDKAHRYRGHFHNDQLSMDLWVKGNQLLADPGNITYTGDMDVRNNLRSAKAHNAPYLGEEPNRFMDGIMGLFHTMNDTNVELYELTNQKIKAALFFKNDKIAREIVIEEDKVTIHDSASKPFEVNINNGLKSDGYGRMLRE
jgi:hypothetical protein